MNIVDIEKLNRNNFRSLQNSLAMPGTIEKIESFYESNLLAIANTLLYSQVSFFYEGSEDFELIQAITNSKKEELDDADYIFCDEVNEYFLEKGKTGTALSPEFSATFIFKCKSFDGLKVRLSGPGINGFKDVTLPVDKAFVKFFNEKNSLYPMGNEVFFLDENANLIALSRTTKVEVL